MRAIFAPEEKIIAERKLWIAVARAQSALGHAISDSVIADYEKVITKVDLASIDAREKVTRHDVKARIEEFNALAGHEAIHAGMTSRDLTENIEALQIKNGLELVGDKVIATLAALAAKAALYADQPIAGRSHNVPAQITTLGKRFASAASVAMTLSPMRLRPFLICNASIFSVRSRLVIPAWIASCPASALNSSIRAFTSWRVIFSRASMDARSTFVITFS